MRHDRNRGNITRRGLLKGAFVATTGVGAAIGAVTVTSNGARARVTGLSAKNISVSGEQGELTALTIAPDLTIDWDGFSESVGTVEIRIAASTPTGQSGTVTEHSVTDVSGTSGSASHSFDTLDLLKVFDASTFNDGTEDGEPKQVGVDLSAGIDFYDENGDQIGPAPVDLTGFTVEVNNEKATTDRCQGEPEDCEGVSVSGTMNTDGSAQ